MSNFKQTLVLNFVLGLVILGFHSPLIFGSLNAHKNPDMNVPGYNHETNTFEDVPCPIEYRIFMALFFCLPGILMFIFGSIAMIGAPSLISRGINFLIGRKE